jgi:predicted permease
MRVMLPRETYGTPEKQLQFMKRALDRVRSIPGVETAATSTYLPGTSLISGTGYLIEGRPEPKPGERPTTQVTAVDPDFFRTLRVRLLSGRLFEARDNEVEGAGTYVVNETFAKAAFPGESPLGKRIRVRMKDSDLGEIVGVVADVRHTGLAEPMKPVVYYSNGKLPIPSFYFVVRSANGDPASVTPAVMRAIESLDPTLAVADARPLEAVLADSIARIRFTTVLLSVFSGFAMLLAAFGLYSLLSWMVARRTSEIGVRMALGARPADVLRLMMQQGLQLVAVGLLTGLAASVVLVRFVQTMLFDVKATDPMAWAVVPAVLALSSVAALAVPAIRAARLEPVSALRLE